MTSGGLKQLAKSSNSRAGLDSLVGKAYTIIRGSVSGRGTKAWLDHAPDGTPLTTMRMPPFLKPMLTSEFGQRPCPATRFPLMLRWPILLLWALGALAAAGWVSEAQTSSAAVPLFSPSFCDQGCAIADLDGDGRPDLVIAKAEGWGPSGFQYRIDLDLTTRVGLSSFSVSAQRGGLRIIPRDVNGDWDLDLVITSAWSFAPVGVWINDGHGGFTRGDPTVYPQSTWNEGPGVLSETPHEPIQATVPEFSRNWPDSSEGPSFCHELILKRLPLLLAAVNPPRGAPRRPQTRGPPFSLSTAKVAGKH
jgi:hypothetical protein